MLLYLLFRTLGSKTIHSKQMSSDDDLCTAEISDRFEENVRLGNERSNNQVNVEFLRSSSLSQNSKSKNSKKKTKKAPQSSAILPTTTSPSNKTTKKKAKKNAKKDNSIKGLSTEISSNEPNCVENKTSQNEESGDTAYADKCTNDESLRWNNVLHNPDDEQNRINLYKINRRKRYIDFKNRLLNVNATGQNRSNTDSAISSMSSNG